MENEMYNVEVSVIMPSFSSEEFITQSIESVLAQSHKNWELIVIDDSSPDGSNAIIEAYIHQDKRIKLIKLDKNSGPAVARNRGIEVARGKYIAFLDSDDIWTPDKLEKQIAWMRKHDIALSYTAYHRIEAVTGKVIDRVEIPLRIDYHELLKQNIIGCLTAVYDVEKLGKVYMPLIRKRQDFGLWLQILKKVPYAYGLDEALAYYRIRNDSISSNKFSSSRYNWKLYREVEKLSWYKAVYYFACYTYRSLLKYSK